jgi:hypothetical protein
VSFASNGIRNRLLQRSMAQPFDAVRSRRRLDLEAARLAWVNFGVQHRISDFEMGHGSLGLEAAAREATVNDNILPVDIAVLWR